MIGNLFIRFGSGAQEKLDMAVKRDGGFDAGYFRHLRFSFLLPPDRAGSVKLRAALKEQT
jgi:hypothetical protein